MKDHLKSKSAVEIFEMLLDEWHIMSYVVLQPTTYASQNNPNTFQFSIECFQKFIGILLLTGYNSLPQERMYWSEDDDHQVNDVRQCMARNRCLDIKRNLRFNDDSPLHAQDNPKRSFKIALLLEKLNKNIYCLVGWPYVPFLWDSPRF